METPESCRGIPRYFRASRYERAAASVRDIPKRAPPPFVLSFVEVKRIKVKREVAFMEHRHSSYEIFAPEKGSYECSINGAPFKIRPGELAFVQPGDVHSDRYLQGSSFLIAQYDALDIEGNVLLEGVFAKDSPPEARSFAIAKRSRLALLLEAIGGPREPRQEDLRTLEPLAQALFWELLSLIPEKLLSAKFRNRRSGDAFKLKALEEFANTPVRDFDARALAMALGMSRRTMEAKFKYCFGSSPAHAFMAFKSAEAVKLLAAGLGAKEASEALGFANQFHFSRVCRRYAGAPPSELRRKA